MPLGDLISNLENLKIDLRLEVSFSPSNPIKILTLKYTTVKLKTTLKIKKYHPRKIKTTLKIKSPENSLLQKQANNIKLII